MKRVLQTVLVKKSAAPTRAAAEKLARPHADRIYTSREDKNYWRFRQRPPGCFTEGPFTYTTKCIRNGKVCLVYARLKKGAEARKACR
jgi:hypothetical protein